jgi:hypothetical protein
MAQTNDFDRIVDVLAQYEVDNPKLAEAILGLFISIAGDKLKNHEGVKAEIYKEILQKGWIKPEHYKTIYEQYSNMLERQGFKYEPEQ